MISLRSHAISLAAVFLALAVGVALGSGLLSNTLLSGLRDDKHQLQNQINSLTDDKNALNEKLNAAGEFDAQMSPRILHDALEAKSVVVFRTPDANDDDVDALTRMVGQAGGTVTGTIALTQEFVERQRFLAPLTEDYLLYAYRYLKDDELIALRDLMRDAELQWLLDVSRQGLIAILTAPEAS